MPRDHARIFTAIWGDDDFRDLSAAAQRLYFLLITQREMTYAGDQELRVHRWAACARDTTPDHVRGALEELGAGRFVLTDHATEEVLTRSYLRVNEIWKQPRLLTLALRQIADIHSPRLRSVMRSELLRLPRNDDRTKPARALAERLPETEWNSTGVSPNGSHPVSLGFSPGETPADTPNQTPADTPADTPNQTPADTPADTPNQTPADTPADTPGYTPAETHTSGVRARTGARVTNNHEQAVAVEVDHLRGDRSESDARVSDEPPPKSTDRRPPARCADHADAINPPPCGACARHRERAEAWDAARDRQAAEAEVAERHRKAEDRARDIDRCAMCDGEGRLEGGSVCGHDPEQIERNRRHVAALREQLVGATNHEKGSQ